ncbi:DUF1240 domain-containing protein [Morganella morganii]|uniref:DUF1240 domain-containing protein n=1 Tax=Morganella morganii TaxID=582 RepID=UPI001BDAD094|nr:DUF1240 domain-containing protein [Morganella morganii]MBT0384498.1 DUF1240 domain-containing protein [Morganella morganii subsp. morganii]
MPKWGKSIASTFFLILFIGISILVYGYTISLFKMTDIIIFSGPIAMLTMAMPLVIYANIAMIIEFSLGQKSTLFKILMKYNKSIMRYLVYLGIAGVLISLPISFLVNIYLLDNGYNTCEKISWMSPTTYVKDLSLCGR